MCIPGHAALIGANLGGFTKSKKISAGPVLVTNDGGGAAPPDALCGSTPMLRTLTLVGARAAMLSDTGVRQMGQSRLRSSQPSMHTEWKT